MKKIDINVSFTGVVTVSVPNNVSDKTAKILAKDFALCKVLATCENPDSPDETAFDDFTDKVNISYENAGKAWDKSTAEVSGIWTVL